MCYQIPGGNLDSATGTFTHSTGHALLFENLTLASLIDGKKIVWTARKKAIMLQELARDTCSGHLKPTPPRVIETAARLGVPTKYGPDVYERLVKSQIMWIVNNATASKLAPAFTETKTLPAIGPVVYTATWKNFTANWYANDMSYNAIQQSLRDATIGNAAAIDLSPRERSGTAPDPGQASPGLTKLLAQVLSEMVRRGTWADAGTPTSKPQEVVGVTQGGRTTPKKKTKLRARRVPLEGTTSAAAPAGGALVAGNAASQSDLAYLSATVEGFAVTFRQLINSMNEIVQRLDALEAGGDGDSAGDGASDLKTGEGGKQQ